MIRRRNRFWRMLRADVILCTVAAQTLAIAQTTSTASTPVVAQTPAPVVDQSRTYTYPLAEMPASTQVPIAAQLPANSGVQPLASSL